MSTDTNESIESLEPICNFATGQTDYLAPSHQFTDEEAVQYIPQTAQMQNLYRLRRDGGDSIDDAMIYVLKAFLKR